MISILDLLLLTGLGILGWWAYFFGWQRAGDDAFRQDLFALRDALFDAATTYQIPYAHPAYYTLRRRIHGFIRHPERATLLHGCLYRVVQIDADRLPEQSERAFQQALMTLSHDDAIHAFTTIANALTDRLEHHLLTHSLVLATLDGLSRLSSPLSSSLMRRWTSSRRTWLQLPVLTTMAEQSARL